MTSELFCLLSVLGTSKRGSWRRQGVLSPTAFADQVVDFRRTGTDSLRDSIVSDAAGDLQPAGCLSTSTGGWHCPYIIEWLSQPGHRQHRANREKDMMKVYTQSGYQRNSVLACDCTI